MEAFYFEVNEEIGKKFKENCRDKGFKINKICENFMKDFNDENDSRNPI